MTVGDMDPAALGLLPPTVDARPWFPQLAVLRHAAAFVSHAGMNSTMEALYYGVPMVTFPQMPEQAANADQVQELGLGERLDPETLTPDTLRAAVSRVSSHPTVRARLDRMRRIARDSGGAARGADLIEERLSAGSGRTVARHHPPGCAAPSPGTVRQAR
ncbi:MAG: nucleotide disphospho-sugar-binding domain-containing protein [Pseudonocardia sp.]